jgi:hypothetical protein
MRATGTALAALLTIPVVVICGGVTAVPAVAASATATGPTGMYEPVHRVRALDTRNSGMIRAHSTAAVRVTGLGEVPATEVVAVSVNLSVLTPSSTGSISAFADGTNWAGATMSFQAGQTDQNFETIPVSVAGLIDIRNNSATSLNLIVDILGYHTSGMTQFGKGRYQPMSPTRLLDTRAGRPIGSGQTRSIQVTGRAGIPQGNDVAPVINFTVLTPIRPGSLTVGSGNLENNTPSLSFAAGQTEQGQLLMGLDSSGALPIRNNSAAAIQLIADVVGYYTGITTGNDQTFFASSGYARAYDSRAGRTVSVPPGGRPVPPGRTVDVPIWFTALNWGLPPNGVGAGSINVTVLTPKTSGSISVWPFDTGWDGAATITFTAGQTRQRMLMAKVGDDGDVLIRNNSTTTIILIVDLNGWSMNG